MNSVRTHSDLARRIRSGGFCERSAIKLDVITQPEEATPPGQVLRGSHLAPIRLPLVLAFRRLGPHASAAGPARGSYNLYMTKPRYCWIPILPLGVLTHI